MLCSDSSVFGSEAMDNLEERFLKRLLDFCKERGVIAFYKFDNERVFVVIQSEARTYTRSGAMELLIGALEEHGLIREFHNILKS